MQKQGRREASINIAKNRRQNCCTYTAEWYKSKLRKIKKK